MLELKVYYNDEELELQFEHSLRNVSKWEQKFKRPFFAKGGLTTEDMLEYYSCMILTPGIDPLIVYALDLEQMEALGRYINDPSTASSVPNRGPKGGSVETTTSELVYYWMNELGIPWEAQDWHFNRLMMLVQITNYKRNPPKKQNSQALMTDWADANERQKAFFKTKG